VVNDHVLELIEGENYSMVNKENRPCRVFHRCNLHTVHVKIELQQQTKHLNKSINKFLLFDEKTYKQIEQIQVLQIPTNNYTINN
jgi:hypothetical protein